LRWPDNYFKIFSSYTLEELKYFSFTDLYKANSEGNPYRLDPPYASWPRITSSVNLSIERDSRDLAQFATSGSQIYWSGELGGTVLQGNYDYWKQIVGIEYFTTPFWKLTFSLKAKWGMMKGINKGDLDVPYSERFTPGGTDPDGLVRGYDDSEVGPPGFRGGRSESIYNLELVFPLAEQQFYALLFADAGNAWLTGDGLRNGFYDYKELNKSVGFGFRVVAPMIGIIGFDFGIPLNGPEEDRGKLKPHFQIGRGF
jgi:outer membrane protein insertion porin family